MVRRRSVRLFSAAFIAAILTAGYLIKLLVDGSIPGWAALLLLGPLMIAYGGTTALVNTVVVTVDGSVVRISQRPLPWPARVIRADRIEQLYVEASSHPRRATEYDLRARTTGGDITLVAAFTQPQPALYLEAKLEQHMGITNQPIHDEYRPTE